MQGASGLIIALFTRASISMLTICTVTPELPLTNNIAECALRHWVIARRISHGTRTKQGSRAFALLASVTACPLGIDTCRQRNILPWPYLVEVIAARRKGLPAPHLPSLAA
ncbi:MAG: transposase [Chloroflexota bacterium]